MLLVLSFRERRSNNGALSPVCPIYFEDSELDPRVFTNEAAVNKSYEILMNR